MNHLMREIGFVWFLKPKKPKNKSNKAIVFWLKEPPGLIEYYPSFEFTALAAEQPVGMTIFFFKFVFVMKAAQLRER